MELEFLEIEFHAIFFLVWSPHTRFREPYNGVFKPYSDVLKPYSGVSLQIFFFLSVIVPWQVEGAL